MEKIDKFTQNILFKEQDGILNGAKIGDGMNQNNQENLDRMIKFWEGRLLDTGKRNPMIYYKETKRGTLKLQEPSFDQLHQKIVVEEKELLFWEKTKKEADETELPFLKELPVPAENVAEEILAEGEPEETRKTLKNLRTKARLALGEQGANISPETASSFPPPISLRQVWAMRYMMERRRKRRFLQTLFWNRQQPACRTALCCGIIAAVMRS